MVRIINLLNQKNHYLEKFYSLNESELLRFAQGNFDTIEDFYNMRDHILDMIKYMDNQIDQIQKEEIASIDAATRRSVKEALAIKDEYVNRILAQDLQVLSCIEAAKSNIIRELQEIRRTKTVMGKYKSGTPDRRQLDEEV